MHIGFYRKRKNPPQGLQDRDHSEFHSLGRPRNKIGRLKGGDVSGEERLMTQFFLFVLVLTSAETPGDHSQLVEVTSHADDAPVSVSGNTQNRRHGSTERGTNGTHTSIKFSATSTADVAPTRKAKWVTGASSHWRKLYRGLGKPDVNSTERAESHFSLPKYTQEEMQAMEHLKDDNTRLAADLEDERRAITFARIERNTLVEQMETQKNQFEEKIRGLEEQHAEQGRARGNLVEEHAHQMEAQRNQFEAQKTQLLEEIRRLEEQRAGQHRAREILVQEHVHQMETQKNHAQKECEMLQRQLIAQRLEWEETMPCGKKCQKEIDSLKAKLDELHASHIRSVNSVGTGLDPISDKTFEDRFRCIHDEACPYIFALLHKLCSSFSSEIPLTDLSSATGADVP